MTTTNRFSATATRVLMVAGLAASSGLVMALPTLAHAATFAYVNQSMEVSTVSADNWMLAIANAPNIDEHSGVLLLNTQNATIVGSNVGGN